LGTCLPFFERFEKISATEKIHSQSSDGIFPFAAKEEPTPISRDDALAEKLWSFTEDLVNEKLAA
jgi:hypothetical protein